MGHACPTVYQIRFTALTRQVARNTMVITRPIITVFIQPPSIPLVSGDPGQAPTVPNRKAREI